MNAFTHGVKAVAQGTANTTRKYYRWAKNIKGPKSRIAAMVVPPLVGIVALGLMIGDGQSNVTDDIPETTPPAKTETIKPVEPVETDTKTPEQVIDEINFREFLPAQDGQLKSYIFSNPYISGFFLGKDIWVGYISKQDLIDKGFYVNNLYKFDYEGQGPNTEAKAACSMIGFGGAAMCYTGIYQPYEWGIQSDRVIEQLNIMEEGW